MGIGERPLLHGIRIGSSVGLKFVETQPLYFRIALCSPHPGEEEHLVEKNNQQLFLNHRVHFLPQTKFAGSLYKPQTIEQMIMSRQNKNDDHFLQPKSREEGVASTSSPGLAVMPEPPVERTTSSYNVDADGINQRNDKHGYDTLKSIDAYGKAVAAPVSGTNDAISAKGESVAPSTNGRSIVQTATIKTTTHKHGSYATYEGVGHQCTSIYIDHAKYSCQQYLPGGKSVTAIDAKWSSRHKAKSKNPEGKPYRCPGKMFVNLQTNEWRISVAHECRLSAIESSSLNNKTPKVGSCLHHEGVPYRCNSTENGRTRYRCNLFLPPGISASSHDAKWYGHAKVKAKYPTGRPYRCPGILIFDHYKDKKFILFAHECGHPFVMEPSVAGEDALTAPPASLADQAVPTTKQVTINDHQEEDTVHQMSGGASIGESFTCTRSLADLPPTNSGSNGDFDDHSEDNVVVVDNYCGNDDGSNNVDANEDDDENSTCSDNSKNSSKSRNMCNQSLRAPAPEKNPRVDDESMLPELESTFFSTSADNVDADGIYRAEKLPVILAANKAPKYNSCLHHRYRCLRFLPAGISASSHYAKWVSYTTAKAKNPSGTPYRCQGILIVNQNTNERTIAVAHECTNEGVPMSTARTDGISVLARESANENDNQMQGWYYPRHRDFRTNPQDHSNHFCQYDSGARGAYHLHDHYNHYRLYDYEARGDCSWWPHDYSTLIPHGQDNYQYLPHDGRPVGANYWWPRDYSTMTPTDQYNQYLQTDGRARGVSHSIPRIPVDDWRDLNFHQASVDKNGVVNLACECAASSTEETKSKVQVLMSNAHDGKVASPKELIVGDTYPPHNPPATAMTSSRKSNTSSSKEKESDFPTMIDRHQDGVREPGDFDSNNRRHSSLYPTKESSIVDGRPLSSNFRIVRNETMQAPVPEKSPSGDDENYNRETLHNDSLTDDLINDSTDHSDDLNVENSADIGLSIHGDDDKDPEPSNVSFLLDLIEKQTGIMEKRNCKIDCLKNENIELKNVIKVLKNKSAAVRDKVRERKRTIDRRDVKNGKRRKSEVDLLGQIEKLKADVYTSNVKMDEQENDIKVLQYQLEISARTLSKTVASLESTKEQLNVAHTTNEENLIFIRYLKASQKAARESIEKLEKGWMKSNELVPAMNHSHGRSSGGAVTRPRPLPLHHPRESESSSAASVSEWTNDDDPIMKPPEHDYQCQRYDEVELSARGALSSFASSAVQVDEPPWWVQDALPNWTTTKNNINNCNNICNDDENSVDGDKPFYQDLRARFTESPAKERKERKEHSKSSAWVAVQPESKVTSNRCSFGRRTPHPNDDTMTKKSRARYPGSAQGPKKPSPQQIQSSRKSLRPKLGGVNNEANNNSDEQIFLVEKIVDCKLDRNGVPTYKTRWTGYSASYDTWEPYENVVSTGHV